MKKPIEVKEFQSLIYDEKFSDNINYKYIEKNQFDNLRTFIEEYSASDGNADAYDFMRFSRKRHVEAVTFQNYVGLIQLKNDFQVQILPKIDFVSGRDDNNKKTKKLFLGMLRNMKDFPGKVFDSALLDIEKMNLYELFINMYIQETRNLVKHGLRSSYIEKEDNLNFFKGKLLVGKHIKSNIAHSERFYVTYEEFNQNRPENRLIKATLKKLQKLTTSSENSKELRQLLVFFEMVDASLFYESDFSKVVLDRNTKDYENLMKWSRIFLMNKSFSSFSGSTTSRSLLFSMEKVFESYVYHEIRKKFVPNGWSCKGQEHKYHLFVEPQKQFALRPDIVLRKENRVIILDTKWKNLSPKEKNYGISQADMYQMYAYSKKYKTPDVWLLYPLNKEMRNHEEIRFYSGDDTYVRVFFVDLETISESMQELYDLIN